MNEANIRKYANLMRELDLTGLEIKEDNCVVRLERNSSSPEPPSVIREVPMQAEEKTEAKAPKGKAILCPMVGVFYASPAENEEPFVKEGDFVKKGSVLCIIEAMKLMNEITAEEDGIIESIEVKNGEVVDYGRTLFTMRR